MSDLCKNITTTTIINGDLVGFVLDCNGGGFDLTVRFDDGVYVVRFKVIDGVIYRISKTKENEK